MQNKQSNKPIKIQIPTTTILDTLNAFHGIKRAFERAINIPSNGAKSQRKAAGIHINMV